MSAFNSDLLRISRIAINGVGVTPGRVVLTLPDVSFDTIDDDNGFFKSKVIAGLQALEPKVVVNGYPADAIKMMGFCDSANTIISFYGSYDAPGCQTGSVNGIIQATILSVSGSEQTPGKIKHDVSLGALTRYLLRINGEEVYDIQPFNYIMKINGKDILATHRANAGLS